MAFHSSVCLYAAVRSDAAALPAFQVSSMSRATACLARMWSRMILRNSWLSSFVFLTAAATSLGSMSTVE
jgi:hypothetical protein